MKSLKEILEEQTITEIDKQSLLQKLGFGPKDPTGQRAVPLKGRPEPMDADGEQFGTKADIVNINPGVAEKVKAAHAKFEKGEIPSPDLQTEWSKVMFLRLKGFKFPEEIEKLFKQDLTIPFKQNEPVKWKKPEFNK